MMNELMEFFYWYCAIGIVWLALQLFCFSDEDERKQISGEFSRISRLWSVLVVILIVLFWWMFMLEFYWGKVRQKIRGNQKIPPF